MPIFRAIKGENSRRNVQYELISFLIKKKDIQVKQKQTLDRENFSANRHKS